MGIKNFSVLLKHAQGAVITTTYDQFRGQTWAIDASIFCYRFSYDPKHNKRLNPHIDGFYRLLETNPLTFFDNFHNKSVSSIRSNIDALVTGKNLDDSTYIFVK